RPYDRLIIVRRPIKSIAIAAPRAAATALSHCCSLSPRVCVCVGFLYKDANHLSAHIKLSPPPELPERERESTPDPFFLHLPIDSSCGKRRNGGGGGDSVTAVSGERR
ncbi:hypothetical protein EJB05_35622, partial [Eragrostis curvula]